MRSLELCIERKEEFLSALKECPTLQDVAVRLDVTLTAIRSAGTRLEIKLPPSINSIAWQRADAEDQHRHIVELREQGLTYAALKDKGYSVSQIRTAFIKMNRVDLFAQSDSSPPFLCRLCHRGLRSSASLVEQLCWVCRQGEPK